MTMKFVAQALILIMGFLISDGCTNKNSGEKQNRPVQKAGSSSESRRLSVVSTEYLSLQGDLSRPQGSHDELLVVAADGSGSAYIERIDNKYRVIHNGRSGKLYQMVGDLTISRDGTRVAHVAHIDDKNKSIVTDGNEGPFFEYMGMPKFSPDGRHLVYTIREAGQDRLVIDNKVHRKQRVGEDILLSPDSRFIAYVAVSAQGRPQFIISDFTLKDRKEFDSCGESFVVSDDLSRIAVVCKAEGTRSIKILDFQSRALIATLDTPSAGSIVRKRFASDNTSFVYTTMTDDYQRFLHYNGHTEKIQKDDEIMSDPLVLTEPEGVGVILGNAFKVRFHMAFQKRAHQEKAYGYISDYVASADGRHHAYVAIKAGGEERMRIVVDGNEGPLFDKIVSPIFSPDGRLLVYRARDDGKRFLVVSDMKGKVVSRHKDYRMVFQPAFTADGKSVAYGVLDGNEIWWKVEKL